MVSAAQAARRPDLQGLGICTSTAQMVAPRGKHACAGSPACRGLAAWLRRRPPGSPAWRTWRSPGRQAYDSDQPTGHPAWFIVQDTTGQAAPWGAVRTVWRGGDLEDRTFGQ